MGIRINFILITLALVLSTSVALAYSRLEDRMSMAYEMIDVDPEKGNLLYNQILKEALDSDNFQLAAECNFMMGWSQDEQFENLGRAVIYYLEGVRYAENGDYDSAPADLAWGLMSTGSIFSRFKDFDNAISYYDRAIQVALEHDLFAIYCDLLVASAQLHKDIGQPRKALELLDNCFEYFSVLPEATIARIYNEKGLIFSETGKLSEALETFALLRNFASTRRASLDFDYEALSLHNIGNAYMNHGNYQLAVSSFKDALVFKKENGSDANSIFLTLKDLGEALLSLGALDDAYHYFAEAEGLIHDGIEKPRVYSLYKFMAQLHMQQGAMVAYANYQDLYGSTLEAFLVEKQEIESSDKSYSLELITKRYFDALEVQKRNRSFEQLAKVGSAALVVLIFIILGFHRYSRYRLRRDLEVSLRPYSETVYVD